MVAELKLHGREYVVVPKAEYLRLRREGLPRGTVDAVEYATNSIAHGLRAARERAGLTQEQLAEKLAKSQAMVSGAESGGVHVGEKYVLSVLKACGLPSDWKPSKGKRGRARK